jgi:hypothetical protein
LCLAYTQKAFKHGVEILLMPEAQLFSKGLKGDIELAQSQRFLLPPPRQPLMGTLAKKLQKMELQVAHAGSTQPSQISHAIAGRPGDLLAKKVWSSVSFLGLEHRANQRWQSTWRCPVPVC